MLLMKFCFLLIIKGVCLQSFGYCICMLAIPAIKISCRRKFSCLGLLYLLYSELFHGLAGLLKLMCEVCLQKFFMLSDDCSSSHEDAFLSRLMETGATQNSALNNCLVEIKHGEIPTE